jgi:K(+)-stimulated pyrophosphate-energized sodium pump
VIADLVGDNVGDCAGRGADLFESTAAENIGAMILEVALFPIFGVASILFPLVARALGLGASLDSVRMDEESDPMQALNRGYFITSGLAALGLYAATYQLLAVNTDGIVNHTPGNWLFGAGLIGLVTSLLLVYITQY